MIIKGERVLASRSAAPLLHHLLHGEENDHVHLVQGTEDDARAAFDDARVAGKKFALRHFIISPQCETSRDEALMIVGLLGIEFSFDPATAIVFEHSKPRATAATVAFGEVVVSPSTHWHALVPEIDDSGRVMDSRFSFLRHEKLARLAEQRLSHPHVRATHETAVLTALEKDGHFDAAASLRNAIELDPGEPHREAFSRGAHQMAKRLGADTAIARATVQAAWQTTSDWQGFVTALDTEGFRIADGDKEETLVVETKNGVFVGALHRLARVRKIDLKRRKALHERHEANECTGSAGADPRGRSQHPERPVNSSGGGQSVIARPRDRDSFVNSDGDSGIADESRTTAPPPRCGFQGRAGCLALRHRLRAWPGATEQLLALARTVAMSAAERVSTQINSTEAELTSELESLLALAIACPPLDQTREEYSGSAEVYRQLDDALEKQNNRRENWLKRRPTGIGTLFNDSRRGWAAKLATIDRKISDLSDKQNKAWENQQRLKALIADLERGLRIKRHALTSSTEHREKVAHLRHELKKFAAARDLLAKNPLLAFGGYIMIMLLAVVRDVVDRRLRQGIGGGRFGFS
jgi:hypothetical protein